VSSIAPLYYLKAIQISFPKGTGDKWPLWSWTPGPSDSWATLPAWDPWQPGRGWSRGRSYTELPTDISSSGCSKSKGKFSTDRNFWWKVLSTFWNGSDTVDAPSYFLLLAMKPEQMNRGSKYFKPFQVPADTRHGQHQTHQENGWDRVDTGWSMRRKGDNRITIPRWAL
jgi:hypothetical protein